MAMEIGELVGMSCDDEGNLVIKAKVDLSGKNKYIYQSGKKEGNEAPYRVALQTREDLMCKVPNGVLTVSGMFVKHEVEEKADAKVEGNGAVVKIGKGTYHLPVFGTRAKSDWTKETAVKFLRHLRDNGVSESDIDTLRGEDGKIARASLVEVAKGMSAKGKVSTSDDEVE